MGLFSLLFGCGDDPAKGSGGDAPPPVADASEADLPGLFDESEEGFADAGLRITSRTRRADGTTRIEAAAQHGQQVIGLAVELGSLWSNFELAPGISAFSGSVTLRSVGPRSDALVAALAVAYGVKNAGSAMREELTLAATTLAGGDPRELDAGPVKIKLFHEPRLDDAGLGEAELEALYEQRYAEVYLNIDVASGTLAIPEKDEEYRAPLLRALTGE